MSMARRDYVLISRVINRAIMREARLHNGIAVLALDGLAHDLAKAIGEVNGGFDTDKFLAACGIEPPE
jgi:hypothetical protein